MNSQIKLAIILLVLTAVAFVPPRAHAQRDYFTPDEIELIRDSQRIDTRINVLTHAIDRRFTVLKLNVAGAPLSPKTADKWGELPKGSRFELLLDIKHILQKAIDDIDSLAERPDSAVANPNDKKPKSPAELFSKAVRDLASAANRYGPVLKIELDKAQNAAEKGVILDTLDMCDQIVASVAKLPPETPKKKN